MGRGKMDGAPVHLLLELLYSPPVLHFVRLEPWTLRGQAGETGYRPGYGLGASSPGKEQ